MKNYEALPPSYKGPDPSKRPPEPLINPRGALSEKDIKTLRKYGTRIKTDSIETRVDHRYESIDTGGPFNQWAGTSPESLRRIFVCSHSRGKHTDALRRVILTNLVSGPSGVPATSSEVDEYLSYVSLARKQGDPFEEGIATALEAVLVSPKFLRIERDQPASSGQFSVPSAIMS